MKFASAERERNFEDRYRLERAEHNPNRRDFPDPLDPRLECPLGRLRVGGKISEAEYQAGVKWRTAYFSYLHTIGGPNPFPGAVDWEGSVSTGDPADHVTRVSDEDCERAAKAYKRGIAILERHGKRVLHAVNAIAVFEEPEELGDFKFTLAAAKTGLGALAISF